MSFLKVFTILSIALLVLLSQQTYAAIPSLQCTSTTATINKDLQVKGDTFVEGDANITGNISSSGNLSFKGELTEGSIPWERITNNSGSCPNTKYAIGFNGSTPICIDAGGKWLLSSNPGDIYYDSGRVGIKTNSPQHTLQVGGSDTLSNDTFSINSTGNIIGGLYYGGHHNGLIIGRYDSSPWPGLNGLYVGGNVGIGTKPSGAKLDVDGVIKTSGDVLYDTNTSLRTTVAGLALKGHNHNGVYEPEGSYAIESHNHSGSYAPAGHEHSAYSTVAHTHSNLATDLAVINSRITALENVIGTPLVNNKHLTKDCEKTGGVVYGSGSTAACRFVLGDCPLGWTQYEDWSTTSNSRCDGTDHRGRSGRTSCDSGSHAWENKKQESCGYQGDKPSDCPAGGCVCWSGRSEIGCY